MEYLKSNKEIKLTDSEITILEYLNNNIADIPLLKLEDVVNETYTSTSSVVRLSKKLGFNGFKDLKNKYIQLLNSNDDNIENHIVISSYIASLKQLDKINSIKLYKEVAKIIESSNQIILLGEGTSKIIADVGALALRSKGYYARSASCSESERKNIQYLKKGDTLILISYSGETKSIISGIKNIPKNVKKIAITSNNKNTLSKLSDKTLAVPITQEDFKHVSKISRLTRMVVIDVLVSVVSEKNLQK